MSAKRVVLDANILLRGVFGVWVRSLLEVYDHVAFCSPDHCIEEARRHIPEVASHRKVSAADSLAVLDGLEELVSAVDRSLYEAHEDAARARIALRDEKGWPVVAAALLLNCPVWTEDRDFFGSGVATWTTATIELYLRDA